MERRRKKAQHPAVFEPTTARVQGMCFTAVLRPQTQAKPFQQLLNIFLDLTVLSPQLTFIQLHTVPRVRQMLLRVCLRLNEFVLCQ